MCAKPAESPRQEQFRTSCSLVVVVVEVVEVVLVVVVSSSSSPSKQMKHIAPFGITGAVVAVAVGSFVVLATSRCDDLLSTGIDVPAVSDIFGVEVLVIFVGRVLKNSC
jgi:hypothetical protein